MKRPPGESSLTRVRQLRREATTPERRLWQILRNSQIAGVKFRRQTWIGPFIADFVCLSARLVVEVDGDTHAADPDRDRTRTAWLEQQGFRVLRFTNGDVMRDLEGVARVIEGTLTLPPGDAGRAPPSPSAGEGV